MSGWYLPTGALLRAKNEQFGWFVITGMQGNGYPCGRYIGGGQRAHLSNRTVYGFYEPDDYEIADPDDMSDEMSVALAKALLLS